MTTRPIRPRLIGHRGASALAVDNSREALELALDAGAGGVEIDVRRTADDVLVLHHDAHLRDGRRIRELTADELPDDLLTLVEALEICGGSWTNIEVKNLPDDPDYDAANGISLAVAGLIAAFEAHDRVLVSSFNPDDLARIRAIDPAIPVGWLTAGGASPAALVARAEGRGFDAIHPHDLLVDEGFVRAAHDAGLEVNVWTVNDPDRARQLAAWGVDGIIGDDPAALAAALGDPR